MEAYKQRNDDSVDVIITPCITLKNCDNLDTHTSEDQIVKVKEAMYDELLSVKVLITGELSCLESRGLNI